MTYLYRKEVSAFRCEPLENIMNKILFLIIIGVFPINAICQVYQVHQGYCKKKEMEIITGDSIPKGYAVIQSGNFDKNEIGTTLESLTKKQIRKMKTYGKWRHCCKIFIAFKKIQNFDAYNIESSEEMNGKYKKTIESKVHFYVLVPIWEMNGE